MDLTLVICYLNLGKGLGKKKRSTPFCKPEHSRGGEDQANDGLPGAGGSRPLLGVTQGLLCDAAAGNVMIS